MDKAARKLHQKAQTCIKRLEIKWRAWQRFNKPLFYIIAGISWLFSTLACGAVLDIVLPKLEQGWVVKIILYLIAAFFFFLIFALRPTRA
jgi:hypothetical protein